MIIGVDPGLTGAIAALDDHGRVLALEDMPTTPKRVGKGSEVNGYLLAEIFHALAAHHGKGRVWLEAVSAMPKQGVTSVWSFGMSVGMVRGVVAALGFPLELVRPQEWKKFHGILRKEKDASRTLAISKHPELARDLAHKKDHGRADALLIAEYGLRHTA